MASGPITSWQTDGETMEIAIDFIFLGSKITTDCNCSYEIKRCLLLQRKAITNLDSVLKRRHYFANKGLSSQAMVFPVVTYVCESWTIKKTEHQRTDTSGLWFWRRLLRVPWTQRSSQSWRKSALNIYWKDWCWNWSCNTLATWCEEATH